MAHKFSYIVSHLFSGRNPIRANFSNSGGNRYQPLQNKLRNDFYLKKLKSIYSVENLNFEKCIEKYDSKDTMFYVNPPYFKREKQYSLSGYKKSDHDRLKEVLTKIKGKFILSYYDFDQLNELYPKENFNVKKKNFKKMFGNYENRGGDIATEILIMNYKKNKINLF